MCAPPVPCVDLTRSSESDAVPAAKRRRIDGQVTAPQPLVAGSQGPPQTATAPATALSAKESCSTRGTGWFSDANIACSPSPRCSLNIINPEQDLDHWRSREAYLVPQHTLAHQHGITFSMRAVLVRWLAEVVSEFNLSSESFLLSVNFLDRYLATGRQVERKKFQLLGITALWVAAKYEEIYPPTCKEMVEMTDCSYTVAEMLATERDLLIALRFELSPPTALRFLHAYAYKTQACTMGSKVMQFAECLVEMSVLNANTMEARPSKVAAAALCYALTAAGRTSMVAPIVALSKCDTHTFAALAQELFTIFSTVSASKKKCPVLQRFLDKQRPAAANVCSPSSRCMSSK